ncbi:MAG TPA: hypothetical protein VJ783_09055, partial [Pirellulales bacterium]|nr:hypothetical protein [Pirellulales bacterium]
MHPPSPLTDASPLVSELARRNRRRWWLAAGIALTAMTIMGLIYGAACWRGHALLSQEMEKIAARGEPVWYADLAQRPTDPAVVRGRAIAAAARRFDLVLYEPFEEAIASPGSPTVQAKVRPMIDMHRATIDQIVGQLRQGECRSDYDFQTPAPLSTRLPTVQNTRMVARILAADFRLRAAQGERDQALAALTDAFELDEMLRHEPFAVSQYVRVAVAGYALDDLQIALGQGWIDEHRHEELDARLVEMESRFRLAPVLRGERAAMLTMMENLGRSDISRALEDFEGISSTKAQVLNRWWGSWIYLPRRLHQEAIMLRTLGQMADLVDVPGPRAAERFADADAEARDDDSPICAEFSSHLGRLGQSGMAHRQRLLAARLALAVCRFRELHGRLPDSLAELTDSPLAEAKGLITGQPLVYLKTADGFVISDG